MIDHFGIKVADLNRSKSFYATVLAPLGYLVAFESPYAVSFIEPNSSDPAGDFWLGQGSNQSALHFAFKADWRQAVDGFYEAGLSLGAKDNGKPGIRDRYHDNYYAAFLLDPDGNNIEAVCHKTLE